MLKGLLAGVVVFLTFTVLWVSQSHGTAAHHRAVAPAADAEPAVYGSCAGFRRDGCANPAFSSCLQVCQGICPTGVVLAGSYCEQGNVIECGDTDSWYGNCCCGAS
jgi:hypothetical protein